MAATGRVLLAAPGCHARKSTTLRAYFWCGGWLSDLTKNKRAVMRCTVVLGEIVVFLGWKGNDEEERELSR